MTEGLLAVVEVMALLVKFVISTISLLAYRNFGIIVNSIVRSIIKIKLCVAYNTLPNICVEISKRFDNKI